jgi:apolipoprotein N-acyltransferase
MGTGPAILQTPAGTFGVAESWEVFFPDRTRAAIRSGGEVLLNPTNGASFHGSIVQTQQVASSRLAAIAGGRWTLQAAPTGFTAIIGPDGTVEQRTGISERRVLEGTIQRRAGDTIATRVGDWPALILALGLVAVGWIVQVRSSRFEEDRDRTIVDERDEHLRAEPSGRDVGAEVSQTSDQGVDERLGLLGPGRGDPRGSPAS